MVTCHSHASEPEATWVKKAENKQVAIWTRKLPGSSVHLVRSISHVPVPLEKAWAIYNTKGVKF